jgi:SAM-dependent methyltransferase
MDPPLADESVDVAFCCQVLHHNDAEGLRRTLRELWRVLRPGGRLVAVNETMRFPLELGRTPGEEVEEFEGYEHAFFFHQYWLAARRAGFRVRVLEPGYMPFFAPTGDFGLAAELRGARSPREALARLGRSVRPLRRGYLAWRNLVAGGVSLNMICVKPGAHGP